MAWERGYESVDEDILCPYQYSHTGTRVWAQDCVVIPQGYLPWLHFVNEIAVPISQSLPAQLHDQWWRLILLKMHPTRLTSKPAFFIQGDVFACSLTPSCLFSLARRHGWLSTRPLCMESVSMIHFTVGMSTNAALMMIARNCILLSALSYSRSEGQDFHSRVARCYHSANQ